MIYKSTAFIVTLFLTMFITSCSSGSEDKNIDKEEVKQVSSKSIDPCEFLSDNLLKPLFDIDTVQITRRLSKHSPHPLCTVNWRKKNAAEIEAKTGELMMQYTKDKMAGKDVKMPDFQTVNSVSLTINNERAKSKEAGVNNFNSAMKILEEGMTLTVQGKEVETKKRETQSLDGIGDMARWVPSLNQVSALEGGQIFHVTVDFGDDEEVNKSKAIEIAKAFIKAL